MAVRLTVSEIRQELFRANGCAAGGGGEPSSAAVGTLFHRVLAGLLHAESPARLAELLRDHDCADQSQALRQGVYDRLFGPLLTREAAALAGQGTAVLSLWTALQRACDWLAEVWGELVRVRPAADDAQACLAAEQPVRREFIRPGWSDAVEVVGQIDALVLAPQSNRCCILEWKLGQTSPELDLSQACLYHLLLNGERGQSSALALVSFLPARHERLFTAAQLQPAQAALLELIGRLAKVDLGAKPPIAGKTQHPKNPIVPRPASVAPPTTPSSVEEPWLADTSEHLLRVLKQFKAPCKIVAPPVAGPTFVRFFLFPEKGITPRKVMAQAENLHLHLGLAAAPGMTLADGRLGVDIPRPTRESIPFSRLLPFLRPCDPQRSLSAVPVGLDLAGEWKWLDLADASSAHALVVGTPGSGKSQWLRTAVAALMHNNTPETLELLLIDPKQNAFQFAKDAAYLARPIVVPGDDVAEILEQFTDRMSARNSALAATNSQSLAHHAAATGTTQRRVVIVCDEYADLLAACGSKGERDAIELQFRRLAQVGRAPGFHLLLATQQPRGNILSTSIRSLIPVRVALRVTTPLESKVALDDHGADRLLGHGDLYYRCIGNPQRLQGAWLPEEEESLVTAAARSGVAI